MPGDGQAARIALWLGGLCSLVIAVLLNAHDSLEWQVDGARNLAITVVCLVPVALAAGSLFGRRVLLLPAAIAAVAIGPVLWSGLPLLWVPAIGYAVAFARLPPVAGVGWIGRVAAVIVPVGLAIAGLVLLFDDGSERCGSTAHSSLCSTVPSGRHIAASVGASALAVVAGWLLARPARSSPQRKGEISPRNPQVVALVPHRRPQAK